MSARAFKSKQTAPIFKIMCIALLTIQSLRILTEMKEGSQTLRHSAIHLLMFSLEFNTTRKRIHDRQEMRF